MDFSYLPEEEPPPIIVKKPKLTKAEKKLRKLKAAKMALSAKMRVKRFISK